jgi:hypothetical protein
MTTVATIDHPPIGSSNYQLLGEVWYTGIRGTGYLEMWSYFADGSAYFTRTLDTTGALQSLSGDSNWRSFVLPFHAQPETIPTKIVVNIVLPGKGTIKLSPLALAPIVSGPEWWSPQTGAWIGGILGALLGSMCGLIGWLSARGRAPRFVIASIYSLIAVAAGLLIGGVFALANRQPWYVYYPLLLCGGIVLVVIRSRLPALKRRYAELELRKITAMDLPA